MNAKQSAAFRAVEFIRNGMTVGLGTGSTAYWAIQYLGARVKEGLDIRAIATSLQTESIARELGIPLIGFKAAEEIDLSIDGADEVDENLQLIKGGGGALLREKIVASATKFYVVIVDELKLVKELGKFKLPVEIIPFGWEMTGRHLSSLGCRASLRYEKDQLFHTDNGNYILDCDFGSIPDPRWLQGRIKSITGVVDNGLFVDIADRVIVGLEDGTTRILEKRRDVE
jgi:ribose 5-phosphate isomerase A